MKVEVDVPCSLCGRKATSKKKYVIPSELKSCVKVEVDVPCSLCGRKATSKKKYVIPSELKSCAKVEVAVLGSPSLIVLMDSVDVKQHRI